MVAAETTKEIIEQKKCERAQMEDTGPSVKEKRDPGLNLSLGIPSVIV